MFAEKLIFDVKLNYLLGHYSLNALVRNFTNFAKKNTKSAISNFLLKIVGTIIRLIKYAYSRCVSYLQVVP